MIIVYGLKNCDSCRLALKWLKNDDIEHQFIDIRADGLVQDKITTWESSVGWENLLNRRSTTWRGLNDGIKNNMSKEKAISLMSKFPTLIKRPVFETEKGLGVGFKSSILYPGS